MISGKLTRTPNIMKKKNNFLDFIDRSRYYILAGLVILVSLILKIITIQMTFDGHHSFNDAIFSIFARNYLHYGYNVVKLGPVLSFLGGQFQYYLNHPPLLGILVSFSFASFGIHEWSARIIPIIFSTAALPLFFLIIKKIWNTKIAFWALFFFALMPASIFFGRMTCFEPLILFFYCFIIFFYLKFYQSTNNRQFYLYLSLIGIGFLLGSLIDFPIFYVSPIVITHSLIFSQSRRIKIATFLVSLLPLFVFLAYFLYAIKYLLNLSLNIPNFLSFIKSTRSSSSDFSLLLNKSFFKTIGLRWVGEITPIVSFLALIWIWDSILNYRGIFNKLRAKNHAFRQKTFWALAFLAIGMANLILFTSHTLIHDYFLYYSILFISLVAAISIKKAPLPLKLMVIIVFCFFSYRGLTSLYNIRNVPKYTLGLQINREASDQDLIIGLDPESAFYADKKSIIFGQSYNLNDPVSQTSFLQLANTYRYPKIFINNLVWQNVKIDSPFRKTLESKYEIITDKNNFFTVFKLKSE